MVGNKIQEYIDRSNHKNRQISDYIYHLKRKKSNINENLNGKAQIKLNDSITGKENRIEGYIDTRQRLVPILEETIYWQKEYKRRDDAEEN